MKKILFVFAAVAAMIAAVSCNKKEEEKPVNIMVQLMFDGSTYSQDGVSIALADATGTATYEEKTNTSGVASFTVPAGMYTASASFKNAENGVLKTFSGSLSFQVVTATPATFSISLNKVEASQIIIKEFYYAGCQKNDASGAYSDDAYVTIYNNTEVEADASEIVFGLLNPANAHATNKFYKNDVLSYENSGYVPAYSAIWRFQGQVTIAPYSSLTVAIFGAIDHTKTYTNSVDLSSSDNYVMSKEGISQFTNSKYQVAETIDKSHYLTAEVFNLGTAWVLSNTAPAFFIGKMPAADLAALVANTDAYDLTAGTTKAFCAPKFPTANVIDCVECWESSNLEKSKLRFPASLNTGHVTLTSKQGHTIYRNVDSAATNALKENEGKIVLGYAGDPTGIDAEASIKAGCHIVYSDTNSSEMDFHERAVSSLKK